MNVVILTQFFWPEGADYKYHVMAAELARRGHAVTVITTFPNHPLGRVYDGYRQAWRRWEEKDGYRVLRLPIYPDHSASGLRRALCYLSFTLAAATLGVCLGGRADVAFINGAPITLGLLGYLYKWLYGARIILNVEDLWPDAITASGLAAPAPCISVCGRLAGASYRVAQLINVHTNGFKAALVGRGVAPDKITVTPVWANREVFYEAAPDEAFGDKYGLRGKTCLVYVGNIGKMQNLANILAAAERLRDLPQLRFVLVGDGNELDDLMRQVWTRRLTNVVFTGYYPLARIAGVLAWGAASLVSLKQGAYLSINFPSKISGYLAVGKPVLVCADGEARDIVEGFGVGLACRPDDPDALADLVRRFLALPAQERTALGRKSRAVFEQFFDKDILVKKYLAMIEAAKGKAGEDGAHGV